MQYILTQEEYDELIANQKKPHEKTYVDLTEKQLQKLCTKICDTHVLTTGWRKGEVWGCILTSTERHIKFIREQGKEDGKSTEEIEKDIQWERENEGYHEWYCDDCVMQDICPYPHKEWSK